MKVPVDEKFRAFIDLAKLLNEGLGITPLLFGSLGLERRLNLDLSAQDIDVLVPQVFLREQWPYLKECVGRLGYSLLDLREHEFWNGVHKTAFAAIEDLGPFVGIDVSQVPIVEAGYARYMLLTLSQYLAVYRESSKDSYRRDKNNSKDLKKIAIIEQRLADSHKGNANRLVE
ncbi:MAG: hypothetical protein ACM3WU_07045 [Bacillota bacterium]